MQRQPFSSVQFQSKPSIRLHACVGGPCMPCQDLKCDQLRAPQLARLTCFWLLVLAQQPSSPPVALESQLASDVLQELDLTAMYHQLRLEGLAKLLRRSRRDAMDVQTTCMPVPARCMFSVMLPNTLAPKRGPPAFRLTGCCCCVAAWPDLDGSKEANRSSSSSSLPSAAPASCGPSG